MRILIPLACGVWALSSTAAFAQDPVKIDPAHHKVELENADVRVLRITFGPGETAPLHDHPNSVAGLKQQPASAFNDVRRQHSADRVCTASRLTNGVNRVAPASPQRGEGRGRHVPEPEADSWH